MSNVKKIQFALAGFLDCTVRGPVRLKFNPVQLTKQGISMDEIQAYLQRVRPMWRVMTVPHEWSIDIIPLDVISIEIPGSHE